MCSYSYFTGLTNVKQIGEGGGVIPEPKVFVKQANIILHSFYVQSEFPPKSAWGRWSPFFRIHALLVFSLSAIPHLKKSPALLSPSLFVLF